MSNQAAYLDGKDKPFRVDSAEVPKPKDNEVIIKNHAIAINPVDWKIQDSGMFIKSWPIVQMLPPTRKAMQIFLIIGDFGASEFT